MIGSLKELYQEKCLIDEMPEHPNDFYWFNDETNHLIGISKTISLAEKKLISLMLDEIVAVDFNQHTRLLWLDLLLLGKTKILDQLPKSLTQIRFIFFNHNFDSENKVQFGALIKQWDQQFLTLFLSGHYGVIIDFTNDEPYTIEELEDLVEAVSQDFYCSMTFYRTHYHSLDESLYQVFTDEFNLFQNYYSGKLLVMQEQDLLIQYLIEQVGAFEFNHYKEKINQISYDQIEVVKCYLENNFNLSFGAKILYMHRNTFMNKLERFIQGTGLNVKEFRQAVIAYLLIENLENEAKM